MSSRSTCAGRAPTRRRTANRSRRSRDRWAGSALTSRSPAACRTTACGAAERYARRARHHGRRLVPPVNAGDGMWVQIPPNDPWDRLLRFAVRRRVGARPAHVEARRHATRGARCRHRERIRVRVGLDGADSHFPRSILRTVYLGANRLFRIGITVRTTTCSVPTMTRTPRQNPTPGRGTPSYHAIFLDRRESQVGSGAVDGHRRRVSSGCRRTPSHVDQT